MGIFDKLFGTNKNNETTPKQTQEIKKEDISTPTNSREDKLQAISRMKCLVCGKSVKDYRGLSSHIIQKHQITLKQYYDKYLKHEGEGICAECGKETNFCNIHAGYGKFCCCSCSAKNIETRNNCKKTCLEKYGVDNPSKADVIKDKIFKEQIEKYGGIGFASKSLLQKQRETMVKKYGVEAAAQSEEIMNKMKKTNLERYGAENVFASEIMREKIKETMIERYGVDNPSKSIEIMENRNKTNLKRYGFKSPMKNEHVKEKNKQIINSPEARKKSYETRMKNDSFKISKVEKELEIELRKLFPDLKIQYKSKEYPFHCDYYVPELDLYIEYNGTWTHGFHFFDENNQEDLNKLEKWKNKNTKYYNSAIKTWTQRDILKLNTAIENNLNYIAWFNQEQAYEWLLKFNGG